MDVVRALLVPEQPGLLPKWLVFTSLLSFFNVFQTYASPTLTRRVYPLAATSAASPADGVTPLTARLFGTWTLLSGVLRLSAAHRLADPFAYRMLFASYAIALSHFLGELLVWRTTRINSGALPAFVVACMTTGWMVWQWGDYVEG